MLLRWWRGTCNFEASWHLYRASTNSPLLELSRGNAQIAQARSTQGRNTHRNVFNSSLLHYIGDPHTRPRRWIFWRWPDDTYRIPLLLGIRDCPPPIHSPIHTRMNFSHYLWRRRGSRVQKQHYLWYCHRFHQEDSDTQPEYHCPVGGALRWRTSTQPDKPQSPCLWSTPVPKAHPTKDQVDRPCQ